MLCYRQYMGSCFALFADVRISCIGFSDCVLVGVCSCFVMPLNYAVLLISTATLHCVC